MTILTCKNCDNLAEVCLCQKGLAEMMQWCEVQIDAVIKAARGCVQSYPVASGIAVTDEGDGYGWLRELRLALEGYDTLSVVSSAESGGVAKKHSGTFLGYRDEHGNEMHCANAFCPHQDKCHKGCINTVAVSSTTLGSDK